MTRTTKITITTEVELESEMEYMPSHEDIRNALTDLIFSMARGKPVVTIDNEYDE